MEDFFGLTGRPFAAAPRTDRYFPADSIEAARTTVVRAVERVEGPALVIGPVGSGKSLLCRVVTEHFRGSFRVAALAGGRINSRRTLWQALLYELGLPYRGMDDGELRLAVVGHLSGGQASTKPVLILVDEAHALSPRLLDELRTLADLTCEGQAAVRLVMAGGPSLEEHFAHPKLEAFSQRLAARCYLEPLSRDETAAFIRAQVEACDSSADALFHADAFEAIFRATDGVPRLVNQVCDHALVLAYADGLTDISAELVEQAWADLQQLPTPWSSPDVRSSDRSGGAIEFGRLEDEEPFEPDAESPSVRFPTERIDRRAAAGEVAFDDEHETAYSAHLADVAASRSAQDDFAPADEATEVELTVVDKAVDPFGDSFEEEEAVVDRFAALDQSRTATRPLTPPPRPTPRSASASQSNAAPSNTAPSKTAPSNGDEATAEPPLSATVILSRPIAPSPTSSSPAAPPSVAAPAPWPSGDPTANALPEQTASADSPTRATTDLRASRPAPIVRKPRKYSQLFSQLRRNSG
ncbi:MAG: AAA family ATPase [Pirellulales bacterium]